MSQPLNDNTAKNAPANPAAEVETWLQTVRTLVESLKYGAVQIVIQNSRVVQIESTEKLRFDSSHPKPAGDSGSRRNYHHGR